MKQYIVAILFLLLIGCGGADNPENACRLHDGVAICYFATEKATHGHLMCNDGYISNSECH
jgi:hypothetical protein